MRPNRFALGFLFIRCFFLFSSFFFLKKYLSSFLRVTAWGIVFYTINLSILFSNPLRRFSYSFSPIFPELQNFRLNFIAFHTYTRMCAFLFRSQGRKFNPYNAGFSLFLFLSVHIHSFHLNRPKREPGLPQIFAQSPQRHFTNLATMDRGNWVERGIRKQGSLLVLVSRSSILPTVYGGRGNRPRRRPPSSPRRRPTAKSLYATCETVSYDPLRF